MRYTYIELNGFTRFALNECQHFAMTITSALQLIIGTNGSGKSSLLEQITPLPPNPNDFLKTGSKIIKLEHNHSSYVLSAIFSPKRVYSFIVDGQEKNDGGTQMVQLELVKEHFGITPEIHQLLLGKERFTTMAPTRRKEWLLKLCDTNYDYAIRVYNKAREQHRDTIGALKLVKNTLVQESEKLLSDEAMQVLQKEADELHQALEFLLEYRKPVENDLLSLQYRQDNLSTKLLQAARQLAQLNPLIKDTTLTEADYQLRLQSLQEQIAGIQALLEKAVQDFEQSHNKVRLLEKAEAQSIETLDKEVSTYRLQLALLNKDLLVSELAQSETALNLFQGLKVSLATLLAELPANPERKYSSEQLQNSREQLNKLITERTRAAEDLQRTHVAIQHYETHKSQPNLQCPKCAFQFSSHYDATKHEALQRDALQRQQQIENYAPQIQALEQYILECGEYAQQWRQFVNLTQSAQLLQSYWNLLHESNQVRDNPSAVVMWLERVQRELEAHVKIQQLQLRLREKIELLQSLKAIGSVDLQTLLLQHKALQEAVESYTKQLQTLRETKSQIEKDLQVLKNHTHYRSQVTYFMQQKRQVNAQELETIRREELNDLFRQLQSELAQRVQLIGTAAQQRSIVNNLNDRIAEFTKQEQALVILVKELSPTEGLIAEGLLGFIKNFVQQMNTLIESVWSYGLHVQSCEVQDQTTVDLDYKFPMKVAHRDDLIPDVSKGSTGMMEIVDMAFKLTAMQYLHLQDSALYLDEAGQSFDEIHRSELAYVIKRLLEQHTFEQVFLISHYFEIYGALSNAEVCVLNKTNIAAPANCNLHVVMH